MTSKSCGRLSGLAARLHPLDTPGEALPIAGYRPPAGRWQPRPAAVLVPVVEYPEPAVVLTVRSRAMNTHAGQVAFPGGGPQGNESFPLDTALREAREEIGLAPEALQLAGLLDRFDTITGFRVTPVVGRILGQPRLEPCPDEVESIFRLPWQAVIDPGQYRRHWVSRGEHRWELITMAHSRQLIWGATAAMLYQFCRACNDPEPLFL